MIAYAEPSPNPTSDDSGLPFGLDRAVLRVLSCHAGRLNPITRLQLVQTLAVYQVSERQVRNQIRLLRRLGHLIGSAPGSDGGYYLITTPEEFQDFLRSEYQAKINDMRKTVTAMHQAASQRWGEGSIQLRLF